MVNRRTLWISCLVAIFGLASLASAQSFRHSTHPASAATPPSLPQGACGPTDITESSTDTVTDLNSVSCNNDFGHADNSYWRAFTLSDFGIVGDFNVCNVEIGVETASSGVGQGGIQPITVNLYTSDQTFPTGFPTSLTLIGTTSTTVADQTLSLINLPVSGTAPAGSQLVVEIFTPNGEIVGNLFFIGSNTDAETAPSYISAPACGITTPTPTDGLIPGLIMHIVMHVQGTEGTALSASPTGLSVDTPFAAGILNNGVLELNESPVLVAPQWQNTNADAVTMTGTASNFTGPNANDPTNPVTYTVDDGTADYGTIPAGAMQFCNDCYGVDIAGDRTTMPTHSDATLQEVVTPLAIPFGQPRLAIKVWNLHIGESFSDVVNDTSVDPFYPKIETILHNGVTGGCGDGTTFCPLQNTLRQEMAVFLLKGFLGSGYTPPACTPPGQFTDVPCPGIYTDFIEDLKTRNITAGCGDGTTFCPTDNILRQEMAVFLLKTLLGGDYTPPACTPPGQFGDVPCPGQYTDFVEDLKTRGITAGCHGGVDFCPTDPVTRQEMAAFLSLTFSLVLYGP